MNGQPGVDRRTAFPALMRKSFPEPDITRTRQKSDEMFACSREKMHESFVWGKPKSGDGENWGGMMISSVRS